jgi:hypothetical protein
MRSKHFLGFVAAGLTVAGFAPGCGGDDTSVSTTGGTGGATSSVTSTTVTSTGTMTTTGPTTTTSTGMADTNTSCATAVALTLGMPTSDVLAPMIGGVDGDEDFFTFDGVQGQQVILQITAKQGDDPQDPTFIDSVITLYDATGNTQIAENDDPFPRFGQDSEIFTVLPADGTYCVRVKDFNAWIGRDSPAIDGSYEIFVGDFNPQLFVTESEPNDDGATATDIPYFFNMGYAQAIVAGTLDSAATEDVYTFTIPGPNGANGSVVVDPGGRATTWFAFQPATEFGSGSTSFVGKAYIVDPLLPAVKLAEIDVSAGGDMIGSSVDWVRELFTPIELDKKYELHISKPAAAPGTNPFYYFYNFPDVRDYQVETSDATNGAVGMAETATQVDNEDGSFSYYVQGDLLAGVDVDYFKFAVPAGVPNFSVSCNALTAGSGLVGFTAEVRKADDTLADPSFTSIEANPKGAEFLGVTFPANTTDLYLRVNAASQTAGVTGSYYRCSIYAYTPVP